MAYLPTGPLELSDHPGGEQALCANAKPEDILRVIEANEQDKDGRSQWLWIMLPNGDILLGTFPQGATYEDAGWERAFEEKRHEGLRLDTCKHCGLTIMYGHPYPTVQPELIDWFHLEMGGRTCERSNTLATPMEAE